MLTKYQFFSQKSIAVTVIEVEQITIPLYVIYLRTGNVHTYFGKIPIQFGRQEDNSNLIWENNAMTNTN